MRTEAFDASGLPTMRPRALGLRIDHQRTTGGEWRTELSVDSRLPAGTEAAALDAGTMSAVKVIDPGDGRPPQVVRDGRVVTYDGRSEMTRSSLRSRLLDSITSSARYASLAKKPRSPSASHSSEWLEGRFPSTTAVGQRRSSLERTFGVAGTVSPHHVRFERRTDSTLTRVDVDATTFLPARQTYVVRGRTVDSTEFIYSLTPAGALVHSGLRRYRMNPATRSVVVTTLSISDIVVDRRIP
jgi:hypothetical protein